jgi:hypothetical protein
VKLVMRPMTKMLNPLVRTLAGRRHFRMAAQIRHVGRRSGRPYMTPVGARLSGDVAGAGLHNIWGFTSTTADAALSLLVLGAWAIVVTAAAIHVFTRSAVT